MSEIILTPEQVSDLRTIGEVSEAKLCHAIDAVGEAGPLIAASKLRHRVDEVIGNKSISSALVRQLVALSSFRHAYSVDSQETVSRLRDALEKADVELASLGDVDALFRVLVRGLEVKSFAYAAKALSLSFEHENILSSASVLTDIRPVFDDNREAVVGDIVYITLKLYFMNSEDRKQLSLALDMNDVSNLITKLQNAQGKARALQDRLSSGIKSDVFIAGEEIYGFVSEND